MNHRKHKESVEVGTCNKMKKKRNKNVTKVTNIIKGWNKLKNHEMKTKNEKNNKKN